MSDDLTGSLILVKRAKDGDEEALNRLFERYYERVRRVVRVRLGRALREVVDSGDVLQDTFLAAVTAFDRFEMRDEASLIHWLAKLAERQIIATHDYHNAQKRDHNKNLPLVGTPGESTMSEFDPSAGEPSPPDQVATSEESELVDTCVSELPPEYRDLIILRHYVGASWARVAEETGRPSAAAARMMHGPAMIELAKLLRRRGAG